MKVTYKQKLFFYFVVIFALFTTGIIVFEQSRDRQFRTEALQERLDAYTMILHSALEKAPPDPVEAINRTRPLLPDNLRITLIDRQGRVRYDNAVEETNHLENHAERPEIIRAQRNGKGTDIRFSASNGLEYIYYARRFTAYFLRVAFPYDIRIRYFLQAADNRFLYFILILFLLMLALINFVAGRFGKSIKQLKELALSAGNGNIDAAIRFPDDELGEIGSKIKENYEQITWNKKKISLEREKLLQHVHTSGEGLCFFSHDRKVEFYNGLFIQYLNFLTDGSTSDPPAIFTEPKFNDTVAFLSQSSVRDTYFETLIRDQGRFFNIQVNLFEDQSFEIIINDVTRREKTRLLKQEMTGNIAHELRTPITSIRGYLELILSQWPDAATTKAFIEKAFNQTLTLSELIRDMSLISKIEETPRSFLLEAVKLNELLLSLKNDLAGELESKNIRMRCDISDDVVVNGNRNLLYSVFRNLTDNVIRHAGENIEIHVRRYGGDEDFYYLTYADTGVGISGEQHLNRLFERFYRVNEGRTRNTGGSGLGLSIVKNAILFHKGNIVVKNRAGGGLKFIFNLPKYKQ